MACAARLAFAAAVLILATSLVPTFAFDCQGMQGVECIQVRANNYTFSCRRALPASSSAGSRAAPAPAPPRGKVLLLHGFPEWSVMYVPLMQKLASAGYEAAACNQRGYSTGARPLLEKDYDYRLLVSDVWATASALNFASPFHLVGHDHGALLGWTATASAEGKSRLLSWTALSVPHADAFSAGLFGPNADIQQQIASQYFTMFTLPNSASIHYEFWWRTMGESANQPHSGRFDSPEEFQHALWWYNGAQMAGVMAMPPIMSVGELLSHGAFATAGLRGIFGGTPNNGTAAPHPIGKVTTSTLFVCGSQDTYLLCDRPYSHKTSDYCLQDKYNFMAVDCGHDLLSCKDAKATSQVEDAIIGHIIAST